MHDFYKQQAVLDFVIKLSEPLPTLFLDLLSNIFPFGTLKILRTQPWGEEWGNLSIFVCSYDYERGRGRG